MMTRPVMRFNPRRYVQTIYGNVRTITEREAQTLLIECREDWLEDLAEYLEDERPDLQTGIDRAMEVRGFDID